VLWPPENQAGGDDSKDSLVLRISAAGGSVLLTGDIDRDTEAELLRRGVPLASQVLKVAAHGARNATASAFLERARPEVALIAQGRGRFREAPSEETLARLAAAGARVLRTDRDGAVTVLVRDGRLQIQTWQDLSWTSSAPSFAVLSVFRKE
jgi:competence protein ComEC